MRYWYVMPISEIAKRYNTSDAAIKKILQRIREKLKAYLEKEGVGV